MGTKNGFAEISRREMGLSSPRCFSRRFSASEVLVKRLDLYGNLNGHQGCVNTVEFNSTGELLVSGSDDRQVILWDWSTKTRRLSYSSGHCENIFQTRIMPYTDDRKIVTSSADGQVRLGQILEDGQIDIKRLGRHRGCVYKLAVEPGSPHIFYSCGEDGYIQHFDLRSSIATKLSRCMSFSAKNKHLPSSIRLNTIAIDPRNPNYLAVGGSDEYARVYDIRKFRWDDSSNPDIPVNIFCPNHLTKTKGIHITGLAYSNTSELLISYSDEYIYLFQKNMGLAKLEEPQVYLGHRNAQTVKGVSFFGPDDDYVLSGSDCGHIFIWRKRGAKLVRLMIGDRQVVNHLEPHPHMPIFATCGIENDVKLWAPIATDVPPLPDDIGKIMESNRQGREDKSRVTLNPDVIMHVLRLQRRQTSAFTERRYRRTEIESDEENGVAYELGSAYGNASFEEGSTGNCNIC
ncbi:hypothetical protein FNV43_RR05519 [Rhamnella rubrinervis]|uniref:DDB1- and CUL4-associated factor 8 n=1 Tax=Rhamnella rubrinervis TaxID=2594499 RepID=A0A8K0HLG3_9ROSA|nr:hypothetical protein FNV43_RR05519 [Rhamnella rubrinervis]